MNEIELKLLLDEAGVTRLEKAISEQVGPVRSDQLLTRYFDTKDHALGRAGMALRLRKEGRRWTQTVKVRRTHTAGLSAAEEVECPAPGGRLQLDRIPEESLRERLLAQINGAELQPVFETEIRRRRHVLRPDGASEVELALDIGEIRAGERKAQLREAEFELVSGNPAALFAAARALLPEGGLVFSTRSKAARGALLAETGEIEPAPAPRGARDVALDPSMTAEEAACLVLAECLEQIAGNITAILASDDPEGPHQLRIGLRRLRTAFRLWRPVLDGLTLRRLSAEAQWLGAEVGWLRDLDVALGDMLRPAAEAAPGEPGFAALNTAVAERAAAERARLRQTLRSARVHALLFDLTEFVTLRGWLDPSDHGQTARLARPITDLAATELSRLAKGVGKRARNIDDLEIEARHELRKSLKGLRYAIEFFAPLYPGKQVAKMLKPMRRLQDIFGNLNDLAMAEALFLSPDAPARDNPEAARAAGRVIGIRTVRAEEDWAHARERWKAVKAVKPFWE